MSFILDALKKSESEHQRQAGPALFEVKVAPPRHRFAPWAAALGVLLAINLVVVGWMLTRGSSTAAHKAMQTSGAVTAITPPSATVSLGATSSSRTSAGSVAASGSSEASADRAPGKTSKVPDSRAGTAANAPASIRAAVSPSNASATEPSNSSGDDSNPADFAPAIEPAEDATIKAGAGSSVVSASEGSLPSYRKAASVPGADLPTLHLDLHVYAARPGRRFVFLNMVKLREGQSLANGVRVERITPTGVVLSYGGKRFLLQRR